MSHKRIAIVYDWMDKMGGVERMLLVLHDMFPQADWYTSFVDYSQANWIKELRITNDELRIHTSFMQGLSAFIKKSRILSLPFFPFAFESFDFSDYDLVISITSSFAKGIITKPGTKHLCILLTPTRWLWGQEKNYQVLSSNFQFPINKFKSRISNSQFPIPFQSVFQMYLKRWDLVASTRPDTFISISQTVAERCLKYYQRESEVIYPPFEYGYWRNLKLKMRNEKFNTSDGSPACRQAGSLDAQDDKGEYFLVVSRLEPYKKVDIVIEAFNMMPNKNLVIIGAGSLEKKLKLLAHANCQFLSNISDQELAAYYSHAQALIMPQEEDFGYVALEAQSCGCPVIAYHAGGATETVLETCGGVFFNEQSAKAIRKAVADFSPATYNLEDTEFSKRFGIERFKAQLRDSIHKLEA